MNQPSLTHIHLTIPGQPEFVGVVRLAAAGIAHRLRLSMEDSDDLKLAVTEACGHLLGLAKTEISVDWEIEDERLTITVKGVGSPQPASPAAQWSEIGLFLIHALMDDVAQFESDGHAGIRMVKTIHRTDDE
ncbi:MAG: ATP-binding protein [Armatimonadetes bacterium]|nr:ATP-binding protein [Armatimonadota bacterium]